MAECGAWIATTQRLGQPATAASQKTFHIIYIYIYIYMHYIYMT